MSKARADVKFPKRTLAKVGQCISCRARDETLSDEHIVPFGLSGPWVLERASCAKCARITSAFERSVLKDTRIVARATMGLPTRRPTAISMKPQWEHQGGMCMSVFDSTLCTEAPGTTLWWVGSRIVMAPERFSRLQ
jgi:hypothetical protein